MLLATCAISSLLNYRSQDVIQHGKHMSSLYAHFEDLSVTVGQLVDRETVLGMVGSSGRSTGPHLHFEVRVAGTPVDPSWVF
jgi:murein DD-endopeptidase MepM/ murein hydrolase activator NlpD